MILGVNDCVKRYAKKRGISVSKARTEFNTALDVICEACEKDNGVSFRGLFSIKKTLQKARRGVVNGQEWSSPEKRRLVFRAGAVLSDRINK